MLRSRMPEPGRPALPRGRDRHLGRAPERVGGLRRDRGLRRLRVGARRPPTRWRCSTRCRGASTRRPAPAGIEKVRPSAPATSPAAAWSSQRVDHARRVVDFAIEVAKVVERLNAQHGVEPGRAGRHPQRHGAQRAHRAYRHRLRPLGRGRRPRLPGAHGRRGTRALPDRRGQASGSGRPTGSRTSGSVTLGAGTTNRVAGRPEGGLVDVTSEPWFGWTVAVIVGLPLVTLVLSEVHLRLVRRRSPLARPVNRLRIWLLPLAALLILLTRAGDLARDNNGVRVVATFVGLIAVSVVLGLLERRAVRPGPRGHLARPAAQHLRRPRAARGHRHRRRPSWPPSSGARRRGLVRGPGRRLDRHRPRAAERDRQRRVRAAAAVRAALHHRRHPRRRRRPAAGSSR